LSSFSTIWILLRHRPSVIFIQYSYMLLIVVAIYKILNSKRVVIICDCHTKALRRKVDNCLEGLFSYLKRLSFKCADISIVSNELMLDDLLRYTNRVFILPDKIPDLMFENRGTKDEMYCVFVGAYAVDEPLTEVIAAAEKLDGDVFIYCTGKIPRRLSRLRLQPYKNIRFTDYINDEDYIALIAKSNCVLALTTEEGCLQCAGYEALALMTPLVVSKTKALMEYFKDSAIYVENSAVEIEKGIREALDREMEIKSRMKSIKAERKKKFDEDIVKLKGLIDWLTL
jgi:glycosyltransferase involved in cell wall biosynthesis